MRQKLTVAETFGLQPFRERARQALFALRGDAFTPRSKFGLSSMRLFEPAIALRTWSGRIRRDRRLALVNLYNHTPTPVEQGWSVRKTQVRDFRGGTLTYDSHNGTDFAVPPGTVVTAPESGTVVRISNEFHRGGLKIVLDHGDGLITTSNHLGRTLVAEGTRVTRGDAIVLSGASGLDCVSGFPWIAPHVHFNVWLNGETIDPFGAGSEVPMWLHGNDPEAPVETECEASAKEELRETLIAQDRLAEAIDACRDAELAASLKAIHDANARAISLIFHRNYYPTRFAASVSPYAREYARSSRLTLPFRREDVRGIYFADECAQ